MTTRVIQLADYGGPYPGSFVPMLRAVCRVVRSRGWEAQLAFAEDARGRAWAAGLEAEGIPVQFLPRTGIRESAACVAALGRDADRVLFHTHFTTFDIPAAIAARRLDQAHVVWHLHSHVRTETSVRLRNTVKYLALRRHVDLVLGVATDVAETARRRGAPNVRVFPNAVDTDSMPPVGPDEHAAARERLRLGDGIVLLHYGWDWHRKGGDLFAGAVELLRDRGREVVGISVGAPEEAGGGRVRVLPPTGELRGVLAAADVFVSCSRAEGMPYSVAEALAAEVPVVATAIPGQVALGAGLGGCRLAGLDPEAIADAVEQLLDRDEAAVRADATAARRRMVKRHDLGPWSHELVELYEGLLLGSRS